MKKLVSIFILLIFLSCNKKAELPKSKMNPKIMEYFGSYKEGSWWEYEVKDSNKTERVSVDYYALGTMDDADQEFLRVNFKSTILKDKMIYLGYANGNNISISYGNADNGGGMAAGVKDGIITGGGMLPLLDTIINGNTFKNVLHIRSGCCVLKDLYIAPNIGPIKRVHSNGNVYLLKNYYIKN